MIHPSYSELIKAVNVNTERDDGPVVNSRYSIVLATSKRARQLISGEETLLDKDVRGLKPLSVAVEELYTGKVQIMPEDEEKEPETEAAAAAEEAENAEE